MESITWEEKYDATAGCAYYESSGGALSWERPRSLDVAPDGLSLGALRSLCAEAGLDTQGCLERPDLVAVAHAAWELLASREHHAAVAAARDLAADEDEDEDEEEGWGGGGAAEEVDEEDGFAAEPPEYPDDGDVDGAAGNLWTENYDEDSGYPFYENTATGEVVWEKPPGFDGDANDVSDDGDDDACDVASFYQPSAAAMGAMDDDDDLGSVAPAFEVPDEPDAEYGDGDGAAWTEKFDPDSGSAYFEHAATGEVTWGRRFFIEEEGGKDEEKKHQGGGGDSNNGVWIEKFDAEAGFPYYEHADTGEVVWEKPEEAALGSGASGGAGKEEWEEEWEEAFDAAAQQPYYRHRATGEEFVVGCDPATGEPMWVPRPGSLAASGPAAEAADAAAVAALPSDGSGGLFGARPPSPGFPPDSPRDGGEAATAPAQPPPAQPPPSSDFHAARVPRVRLPPIDPRSLARGLGPPGSPLNRPPALAGHAGPLASSKRGIVGMRSSDGGSTLGWFSDL